MVSARRNLLTIGAVLLAAAVYAAAAHAAPREYKDREYHVEDGALLWGKDPAKFIAIHVPDLAVPGATTTELAHKLNAIANVGGQAVLYDLHGFNENGSKIDEAALEAFREARHQHDWRRMNAMCRVFNDDAPNDFKWRKRAAKTAAKALKDELKVVYWIDGPQCNDLIKAFHRAAPHLVVAAYDGGDVNLVRPGEASQPGMPNIYIDGAHPALDGTVDVVLPAGDATYATLEEASITDVEKEPWDPDNTILSEEERADGWIALFDGTTLNGWYPKNGGGVFVVDNGSIKWIGGEWSQLRTRDRYDNFILRLEWRMIDGGNSGVFIRGPRNARFSKIGMEFQLQYDGITEPTNTSMGAIYEAQPALKLAAKPPMEWNTVEIKADGAHLQAWLNGELVQDIDLDAHDELKTRLRSGFIAIQDHGNQVEFRNIRIKKL